MTVTQDADGGDHIGQQKLSLDISRKAYGS